jgi:CRP-like cAMP-binding protein
MFRPQQPRIERLARVALFAPCTRRELARIDSLATQLVLETGSVLQREGTDASAFFVIVSGVVSVMFDERRVGTLSDGHFFGAIGLLDRGPNVATVTATTPVDVLVFSRTEFKALLELAPGVGLTIMRAHATHTRSVLSEARPEMAAEPRVAGGPLFVPDGVSPRA